MCRRRGLGKARHLHTADMWVKDRLKSCDVALKKTQSKDNLADAMTKYLSRPGLDRHVCSMELFPEEGRANLAPRIAADRPAQEEKQAQDAASRHPEEEEEEEEEERKPLGK